MIDQSKVLRSRNYRWEGVDVRAYKDVADEFKHVTRQTLLGTRDDEAALRFETRYFEVAPGGYSSLEYHEHPHAVIVLRGQGEVRLGDRVEPIAPFDCVYVAPNTVHEFRGTGGEPLGFVCVVDRVRDRPSHVRREP